MLLRAEFWASDVRGKSVCVKVVVNRATDAPIVDLLLKHILSPLLLQQFSKFINLVLKTLLSILLCRRPQSRERSLRWRANQIRSLVEDQFPSEVDEVFLCLNVES